MPILRLRTLAPVVLAGLLQAVGAPPAAASDELAGLVEDLAARIAGAGTEAPAPQRWRELLELARKARSECSRGPGSTACRGALKMIEATVLKASAEAQDRVDKLRVKHQTAFERGDAGTAAAISLPGYDNLGRGADGVAVGETARQWARRAQEHPNALRQHISKAQRMADRLVDVALARRECPGQDNTCVERRVLDGLAALVDFEQHVADADRIDKQLSEAGLGLDIIKAQPGITHTDLGQAVAFRQLLQSNPDVKSFFGGDAVGFSAGSADSTLSFRYVMDLDGALIGRRNRVSLIFAAPTDKSGSARLVDSVDKLKNLTSVKLGWQLTNAPFELPGTGTLNDFALGLTAAQDSRSYYTTDAATPTTASQVEKSYTALSLSVRWAFLANPASHWKTLMVFGHDSQRSFKNGDSETRCPVDPSTAAPGLVSCFTGSWGAPVRSYSRLATLELRQHMPAFDLGLKLKHDLKTDQLDAEIPIYLIRTIPDDAKTTPFSAGISLSRSSGDASIKWGLFVSAPLSFGKPQKPGN